MKSKQEIHKKHNAKRKVLQVSLYEIDRQKMIKKYGHLLTATEAKKVLLVQKITIIFKRDNSDLNVLIVQLKKIGNNINQLALIANQTKILSVEIMLNQEWKNNQELQKLIYQKICELK